MNGSPSLTYDQFRASFEARHEHPLTSGVATACSVLWLAVVPAAVFSRDAKLGVRVFLAGSVLAVVAHLFQPGTLGQELASILAHPWWSARAESRRVIDYLMRRPHQA